MTPAHAHANFGTHSRYLWVFECVYFFILTREAHQKVVQKITLIESMGLGLMGSTISHNVEVPLRDFHHQTFGSATEINIVVLRMLIQSRNL
ncbi:hypothetical protein GDO78_003850 [Eleutherodactylus coqui]|uniref:Uncharacterized protein n=1 Tax=Eleutherodactylus coqui TaxID=57060 RepID=A0A8J6EVD1_ELECQ|nr:hypothetical protein GDO78_003850 [Eleutherodactylus coqui]